MELSQALNLKNCQVSDRETQQGDMNRSFGNRIFDINPLTLHYETSRKNSSMSQLQPQLYQLQPQPQSHQLQPQPYPQPQSHQLQPQPQSHQLQPQPQP
jgi:hypothetical protein